jgi:acetyl/propionyl-CoA carboxylase alpha subunit
MPPIKSHPYTPRSADGGTNVRHIFKLDNDTHALWLGHRDGRYWLDVDGQQHMVAIEPTGGSGHRLIVDGAATEELVAVDGNTVFVHLDGRHWELRYLEPIALYASDADASIENVALAPMPGVVVTVNVVAGAAVSRGDTLLVIESMKLETAIKAWRDGTVEHVHVIEGRTFERSAALVTFAPEKKS